MFDDDDWDFDMSSSRSEMPWWGIVLMLIIIVACFWFIAVTEKHSKEHFKECQEHCEKLGAPSWNWGRYGCECGGSTKP